MYKTEILADSINPQGNRITTMKITFPRMMLAELNTHRMFSRNSASSRAIPFKKMVKMVEENPFIPIAWQKDHKGMQGTKYFTNEEDIKNNIETWLTARDYTIKQAEGLNNYHGVTKQLCNRLLEPFMWHTVIVTATEWENFFNLRCPQYNINGNIFRSKKDALKKYSNDIKYDNLLDWLHINQSQADIHIQAIAELMWDAMNESTPTKLEAGEWHIPFSNDLDLNSTNDKSFLEILSKKINHTSMAYSEDMEKLAIKIATARCARISYQTLGDNPKIDYEADIRLHDMLAESGHWSPFEHVAKAMTDEEYSMYRIEMPDKGIKGWCRNFRGFIQYRSLVDKF